MAAGYATALFTSSHDVGTPEWWRDYLISKMEARRPYLDEREAYYNGDHPLFFATPKFKEAFGDLFTEFADNWCEVVVDAAAERLEVEGFRVGDDPKGESTDKELWQTWQRNGLDAESSLAITEAVKLGEASFLVEPVPDGDPIVTVEHPTQMYVHYGNRRTPAAALKRWQEEDGFVYVTLYLPDFVYRWQSGSPAQFISAPGMEFIPRRDTLSILANALGVVPAISVRNGRTLLAGGRSDLDKVIPLQNAINKLSTDMVVASEFAAFRQRLLTGVEVPRYPEGHPQEGEPMNEAFLSAVSRLMVVEEPDARAHEFAASDLTNYVKAIEMFVQHLAAQSRTPPHYLMGQIANVSGDALKAAETGLVSKCRGKARGMGQDFEDLARLIRRAKGQNIEVPIETQWADMESRSLAETADAALKLKEIEVPIEALWERMGATAQERVRWKKLRDAALAQAMALGLAQPTAQGVPDESGDTEPPDIAGTF